MIVLHARCRALLHILASELEGRSRPTPLGLPSHVVASPSNRSPRFINDAATNARVVGERRAIVSPVNSATQTRHMEQKFEGKVAVVTGAARGIGLACAESLGARGASVVVADRDLPAAQGAVASLSAKGITCTAVEVDVSQKDQVDAMIARAVEMYGAVDIIVANAGIVKVASFLEMAEEDWDAVINVNLKGVFLTCQAGAKQMVKQNAETPGKGGAIITMSSVNAVMAIPTIAAYNASKGGIENLTRCMALALVEHNIRVNAIGPGSIMTDVLQAVASDKGKMAGILSRTPMGRAGDPKEIGEICQFLASNESSYITGQTIFADGGRMALNYTVPVPPEYK